MRVHFVGVFLAFMLAGCGAIKVDDSVIAAGDAVYADFVRGNVEAVVSRLPAQFNTPQTRVTMTEARAVVPDGPPKAARVLAQHTTNSRAGIDVQLIVGYDYGENGVLFVTNWHRPSETAPWAFVGTHVDALLDEHRKLPSFGSAALPPQKSPIS